MGIELFRPRGVDPALVARILGREVRPQTPGVHSIKSNDRVLVTGAGGSIGSEIVKQIHQDTNAEVFLLDRDESGLHSTKLAIDGTALMNTDDLVLADIRDEDRIKEVFNSIVPTVVFHAAALKHLPILEKFPEEGIKSNIFGTYNVLCAAHNVGVSRFINISTDKAADPKSVLGITKRVSERLTASFFDAEHAYSSVRFGNVLGSRGSILETFLAQIDAGAPITVTSPDVERFFMSVEEAVHLVLESIDLPMSGGCFVLDMGEPIKIAQIAQILIELSGSNSEVVYVGLREGEKQSELLLGTNEIAQPTSNTRITMVDVEPITISNVVDSIQRRGIRSLSEECV